jgi:predicted dehydrogenase
MPGDVVRYGIISTAHIALAKHVPAARKSENSKIVAISSRNGSTARQAAEEHDIARWYGSYEELLTDSDIDAVINPLPNSMHCEWTIKAAEAGKHVLCEKPLAITIDECRRMIAACKANDVLLVEAFTHRWNPHLRLASDLIREDAIGRVKAVDAALTFTVAQREGNVRFAPELGGGCLWDGGCYAVYACRQVLSEEPVRATGVALDDGGYGVDTTFSGVLEFPGGALAHVRGSFDQVFRCELTVVGSEGRLDIPNMFDDSGPLIVRIGDQERVEVTPAPDRFRVQLDEFSECVLTGKAPEFPAEDGLKNTAVLLALYEAADQGRTVDVEQVE